MTKICAVHFMGLDFRPQNGTEPPSASAKRFARAMHKATGWTEAT